MSELINKMPALEKAAAVLNALSKGDCAATSAAIAREIDITQSSCYRILQTLKEINWIAPDGDGRYYLAEGLLNIVRPMLGAERLVAVSIPYLHSLVDLVELTVKISVRRGSKQVILARVESPHPLSVTGRVGASFPVVLGSTGVVLLSYVSDDVLEKIIRTTPASDWGYCTAEVLREQIVECRQSGYCANIGRHPKGIDALSAPLRTKFGDYTLSLIGFRGDFDGQKLDKCIDAILATSQDICSAIDEINVGELF